MTARKSTKTKTADLMPSATDLHADPLISMKGLLKLMKGTNAMSLHRWRDSMGMPPPVAHGKYSLPKTLSWLWDWTCQLKQEVETAKENIPANSTAAKLEELKLRKAQREEDQADRILVNRQEYEDAENGRIALAVATLGTIPDRLIQEGILRDENRARAMELITEAVDALRVRIEEEDEHADL